MKTHFCMPTRMRTTRKTTRLSPMSLLDRFREAVFRLIMISALSKASTTTHNAAYTSTYDTTPSPIRLSSRSSSKSSPAATNRHHHHHHQRTTYHHYAADSHHTEAVADCIEFIKRSSANEDTSRENVIPLPVM
ncbi:hypothetical protein Ccrd_018772 [Cynara cardunculus var. scolymus]|uniref:Uncharacterized protein n=1 Tax=Cynara cardunculus var. scolymus TaxID=59895 RepID=A0A103Y5K7_CYNCS|nr:hypothetical protein Ccrd_018772 [Cynara cardunculus var. scolymus]